MNRHKCYPPEVRERAVRLVLEHQENYDSQWAALTSIASKIGCTVETLRRWLRHAEVDQGKRAGFTSSERERLRELERENRELKRDWALCVEIRRVWEENYQIYGARKV